MSSTLVVMAASFLSLRHNSLPPARARTEILAEFERSDFVWLELKSNGAVIALDGVRVILDEVHALHPLERASETYARPHRLTRDVVDPCDNAIAVLGELQRRYNHLRRLDLDQRRALRQRPVTTRRPDSAQRAQEAMRLGERRLPAALVRDQGVLELPAPQHLGAR